MGADNGITTSAADKDVNMVNQPQFVDKALKILPHNHGTCGKSSRKRGTQMPQSKVTYFPVNSRIGSRCPLAGRRAAVSNDLFSVYAFLPSGTPCLFTPNGEI